MMATATMRSRRVIAAVLVSAWAAAAVASLAPEVMARVAAVGVTVTAATTPLDTLRQAPGLVLFAVPAVVAAVIWLVLAPGLLLVAWRGAAVSPGHWLTSGLAASLVVVSAAVESVEAVRGAAVMGTAFAVLVAAVATLCAAVAWRRPRPDAGALPLRGWAGEVLPFAIGVWALLVGLFPKIFFEAFNGDGAHTFEATRLLLVRAVAFFDPAAGVIAEFPGLNSVLFTYPGAWFVRAFGVGEAGVRLPFLLYLFVLGPAVLMLASTGGRRPRAADGWLVMMSLAVYAVVLAFSATYDPYSADIALPATQDTLFLVLLVGMMTASVEHRLGAMAAFTALAVLCSQAAAAMSIFWLAARWLADRAWRPRLPAQAAAFVAGVVAVAVLGRVAASLGAPQPGSEHGLVDLLKKFATLQFTDARRLLFVLVPAGLYPVLALPALRRRDPIVDALALCLTASFGMYYVMAYYSLHYFVPAMILALVLFWRTELGGAAARGPWFVPAAAAAALAALYVSLPQEPGIYTATRDIGRRIDVGAVQGYEAMAPVAFAHADDLQALFPKDMEPSVPDERYGGSPLAFHAHAHLPGAASVTKAYAVTPQPGDGAWDVRVLDAEAYARDRVAHPPGSRGSRLYAVPRDLLFMRTADGAGFPVLDFRPLAKRLFPNLATRP